MGRNLKGHGAGPRSLGPGTHGVRGSQGDPAASEASPALLASTSSLPCGLLAMGFLDPVQIPFNYHRQMAMLVIGGNQIRVPGDRRSHGGGAGLLPRSLLSSPPHTHSSAQGLGFLPPVMGHMLPPHPSIPTTSPVPSCTCPSASVSLPSHPGEDIRFAAAHPVPTTQYECMTIAE